MPVSPPAVIVGNITTMNDALPHAEAALASGGRIVCTGTKEEILPLGREHGASLIDFTGKFVYPGFIDSHSHLSGYGGMIGQVYCGASCGGVDDVLCALSKASSSPEDEEGDGSPWVLGYGYDDTDAPGKRHLSLEELDEASPVRPLLVRHISLHSAYANSAALRELGYTPGMKIGEGEVCSGGDGRPAGLLTEQAAFEAFSRLPSPSPLRMRRLLAGAVAEYNACGFTSVVDGALGVLGDAEAITRAYRELDTAHELHARVRLQAVAPLMEEWMARGTFGGSGSDHLRFGGFKAFADGSIQGYTAALSEDYHDRPGWKGECIASRCELEEAVRFYNARGIQSAIHCNGDAGIERALCAFEKAWAESPRPDLGHTIVHAQTASDSQLARMKACGVVPTFFIGHVEAWGDRHRDIFLGPARAERIDPAGSCVRLGMPFSLHMDTPVLPPTALGGMHCAVNRMTSGGYLLGAGQRISPSDALKAYTVHAALIWQGEGEAGVIRPGSFADFVCLDAPLESARPEDLRGIQVLATVCGGKIVYDARRD